MEAPLVRASRFKSMEAPLIRASRFKSMEARLIRTALLAALLTVSMAARFQSPNFIVESSEPGLAPQIAQTAEKYRRDLAVEWLGQTMPNWAQPCQMTVQVGPHLGAGGATTFVFDRGEVFGWRMTIQGSAERILDSVLPHEITHMIYASHFRRPLPRWADEGGATSVEHASERQKHRAMLINFLHTGRGIAFSEMFAMTEYPSDVMPLYAQAYTLSEFLIYQGGRRKFIEFLDDGMQTEQWSAAVQRHYGLGDLAALQNTWVSWVAKGFPMPQTPQSPQGPQAPQSPVQQAGATVLAAGAVPPPPAPREPTAAPRQARPEPNLIYRIRDKTEAQTLPAAGWRRVGTPPPATLVSETRPAPAAPAAADAGRAEVARPQTMEPSRQLILQWSQPAK
jgi:hypothetical protein